MEKLAGTSDGGSSERGLLQRSNTLTDEDLERQLEAELAAVPSISEALAADGSSTAVGASGTDTSEIVPLWRNQQHSTSPEKLPRVVFKENWKEKETRFRAASPFGHMPGWRTCVQCRVRCHRVPHQWLLCRIDARDRQESR